MSNILQNSANLFTVLTGFAALLGIGVGWLWRVSHSLSKHEGRLDTLEATSRQAKAEQDEMLKTTQENAERLARIEENVSWLRETFRIAIGGHEKR